MLLVVPDNFVEHGEPAELLATCGLDADDIESAIVSFVTPPVAKFVADVGSFTDESESFLHENTHIYRGEQP
ncbi:MULTISPECIES: hypothetical protein [Serratia]|uniref:hypothetical protein n=1 Tax=Serratia TaxID=613 RepID=UPI001F3A7456